MSRMNLLFSFMNVVGMNLKSWTEFPAHPHQHPLPPPSSAILGGRGDFSMGYLTPVLKCEELSLVGGTDSGRETKLLLHPQPSLSSLSLSSLSLSLSL